ncbi:MAG: CIS tube protein, partial [Mucilaginibacter sp.]
CTLTDLTVNFTLFKSNGTPIRAEADCTFQGYIDEKKLAALENRQSPDLTHIRTALAGDTFPLLCYREYGDSKYYYQIAQYMAANYNVMIDFKQLTPGAQIYFPPITGS